LEFKQGLAKTKSNKSVTSNLFDFLKDFFVPVVIPMDYMAKRKRQIVSINAKAIQSRFVVVVGETAFTK